MKKDTFSSGITFPNNATFPFSNFDFSKFETSNSFASARKTFSADDFFGDKARTFEFVVFSPFNFSEFSEFFVEVILPNIKFGSLVKFNFFNFDEQFEFSKFNEFSNQFLKKEGVFVEFSFFHAPSGNFSFDDFNFSGFNFPIGFTNGDFMFSVRPTSER